MYQSMGQTWREVLKGYSPPVDVMWVRPTDPKVYLNQMWQVL